MVEDVIWFKKRPDGILGNPNFGDCFAFVLGYMLDRANFSHFYTWLKRKTDAAIQSTCWQHHLLMSLFPEKSIPWPPAEFPDDDSARKPLFDFLIDYFTELMDKLNANSIAH